MSRHISKNVLIVKKNKYNTYVKYDEIQYQQSLKSS